MPRNKKNRGFLLIAILLLLAAVAVLVVDIPVAVTLKNWNQSPPIASWLGYFNMFETFGHGMGVAVLLLALHQLDPGRRWAIPRIVACALAAGGLADLLKMVVLRTRPYECELQGEVWSTFGNWLPIFDAGSPGQSFPSAHTAMAAGFAAALIWLYPQGRRLFVILAILVGCQRVVCGAHYPSDVLCGAAVGLFAAEFFLHTGRIPTWFDHWERRRWQAAWRQSSAGVAKEDVTL
jgi:membrane-associated phospholipid phosphatase